MRITHRDAEILVKALDSYIRRKIRDYNHAERQGADIGTLQREQSKIEAAKELREDIKDYLGK